MSATYAVNGIFFFLTHPSLWVTAICPLIMTLFVSITASICLVIFALYPQVLLLEDYFHVTSILAWIIAVFATIIEIFLVVLIYSLAVVGCYQDKIFEQTLALRGFDNLIQDESKRSSCFKACKACCQVSLWLRLVILIITLPLHLIPVIGTIAWVYLNGIILAWEYHLYYFELKGYGFQEQRDLVRKQRHTLYTVFGMQAMALEMVPVFNGFFLFTNTVGAALFAADMEEEQKLSESYWQGSFRTDQIATV